MACQIYKLKPLPVATGANYPEPDPAEMAREVTTCKAEIARLTAELDALQRRNDWRGADRLAYEVARLVRRGKLDSRSPAGDALLDYLNIGGPDGPSDVPAWMEEYEGKRAESERLRAEAALNEAQRTVRPQVDAERKATGE